MPAYGAHRPGGSVPGGAASETVVAGSARETLPVMVATWVDYETSVNHKFEGYTPAYKMIEKAY